MSNEPADRPGFFSDDGEAAIVELVRRLADGRARAAVDLAREEGYRAGYTDGRIEVRREMNERLRALILDEDGPAFCPQPGDAATKGDAAQQDTRAGVAPAQADARPSTEAGGLTPVKAAEEDSGQEAGVPAQAVPHMIPEPQPIGRPPNIGGEAVSVPAQASVEPRPPAPLEPPRAHATAHAPLGLPPKLPAASNGRVHASFREIKAWAAHFGIVYTGSNIAAVNNRRKLLKLPPVVQDEDRTAADPGPAVGRRHPPPLPAAEGGLVRASFREIQAWAAFYGISYDGGNVDQVNRRRAALNLPLVAQCEARTRAEKQTA